MLDNEATVTEGSTTTETVEPSETQTEPKAEVGAQATDAPKTEVKQPPERESKNWAKHLSREKKLGHERQALQAERTKFQEEAKAYRVWQEAAKSGDPVKLLEQAGIPPEKVAQFLLSGGVPQEADKFAKLENELKEYKEKFASYTKSQEDARTTEEKQQAEEYRKETIEALHADTENFPVIAAFNLGNAVIDEIAQHHKRTGKLMEPEQAAKIVETRTKEQLPAYLDKLISSPAMMAQVEAAMARKGKASAKASTPAKPEPKPSITVVPTKTAAQASGKKPEQERKVLSNRLTTTTASPATTSKDLSPQQLWKAIKSRS